jgi:hypothetical protein
MEQNVWLENVTEFNETYLVCYTLILVTCAAFQKIHEVKLEIRLRQMLILDRH